MAMTVKQRGQNVATFRFIEVRLMEILSAWVPTTPEMEAKLLFGAHIWDTAQAADALGKRTYELRLPLQHSLTPAAGYQAVLDSLAAAEGAARRIATFYDVIVPGLATRYRKYLAATDSLMDAPTVRIIDRILQTGERMMREAGELRTELPALKLGDSDWLNQFARRERDVPELVVELETVPAAA